VKVLFLFAAFVFLHGCATHSPETNALLKNHSQISTEAKVEDVPFVDQDDYACAPASLSMLLQFRGLNISRDELRLHLVTEKAKGSYQTDLLNEVRLQGKLGIVISGMENLLKEIGQGNPVIVMQNLGLSKTIAPVWHYAVVTGYNLKTPWIRLHTGHEKNKRMNMKLFEETWDMADAWGLLVLNPGQISTTADELGVARGAAGLEQVGKLPEAKLAYSGMLQRWPDSLSGLIGMGNCTFTEKNYRESLTYLKKAVRAHPNSSMAWHNLATLEGVLGRIKDANLSAERAMKLVSQDEALAYRESLKRFLP
jgi:tetratricopeptide (TPR) repeat protein